MTHRIVVLSLGHGGHHSQYLECLARGWVERSPAAELHFVVSEEGYAECPVLHGRSGNAEHIYVHRVAAPSSRRTGIVGREPLHRATARRFAHELRADHLLFMYLDAVQFSLAVDLRFSWPLALSGIYFRPSFHYDQFGDRSTGRDRLKSVAKATAIRATLRNPHLRTIFCLDPYAVAQLARWAPDTDVAPLPEPLTKHPGKGAPSPLLSRVEDGRRRLVVFGSLDERKGIAVVLEALDGLPEASRKKIALLLAGRFDDRVRRELASRIGSHGAGDVQVIADDQRLPEESIQPLLRACDLVMITYQQHVGSSGQLLRAAEAGTPVLATDYGLVGQLVREHQLGLTVDATSPFEIRRALAAWLERPDAIPFDPQRAALFAGRNTDDAFAETILSRILVRNAAIR